MSEVSIAEAKAKLSELLKQVEQGEEVSITRHGKVVAVLSAPRQALPLPHALWELQARSSVESVDLIRAMRDEE